MKVLVLVDERIGSSKQAVALAKVLSSDIIIKNIEYNCFIKIPNLIRLPLLGIKKENLDFLNNIDDIDLIIFSGRRLAKLALYIKRKSKKDIKIISILNPEINFKNFFTVILPEHDKLIKDKYNNILKINGAICDFDYEKIENETKILLENNLKNLKQPFISLIVGGKTKNKRLNPKKFGEFVKKLSSIVKKQNSTLLISTSRRTTKELISEIKNNVECNYFLYDLENTNCKINPYYSFLTLSDIIVATADSINMVCEPLTMQKSVYIYMPIEDLEKKHIKFCRKLIKNDFIRVFNDVDFLENFNEKEFNELDIIKNKIFNKLG